MQAQLQQYVFKILLALVMLGSIVFKSSAQQGAQYSQYMFNGLVLNPAYAGVDEALSLTFVNRSQWVSIDGAPVTQTLSAHTLFAKAKVGVGLSLLNDKIGIHKDQQIAGSAAYHLNVSSKGVLSFGLQGGLNIRKSDYAALNTGPTGIDPSLMNTRMSQTYLNIGMGIYYRSPKFHIGFSIPDLVPEKTTLNDTATVTWQKAHYFLFSKYTLTIADNLEFQPGILFKYTAGVPLSYDLNASLIVKKVLTLGLSYRKSESVDFLLRAQLTPQLQFGYSYDYAIGEVSNMSRGSHELMVNYVFKYMHAKMASPR